MSKTEMPSIRFYGFDNDWEQRKLGDIVERVVRKNTNNESSLPLTISAQYGLVDQITYFNNRVASRDVSNYYLVLNGEFAYNKSTSDGFPFGAVKRLDLYEKGVLSTLYIVFSIKNQSEIDSDYLTVFFDTDRWHKGVSERAAEGARNHGLLNISADDFFDIDIFLPRHKEEQVAIGSYLRHLDHLITLHQRKFEKLTSVKKSMLEKMFPRNGSCYPEIRFKGFTDPWEQRKVGEVSESYSGGTPSVGVKEYYGGQIPFIRSAEINSEITELFLTEEGLKNSSARLVAVGDILYALYGATSGEVGRARLIGAINQAVLAIKPHTDYDSEYLAQWLRKSKHSIIETYLQGGQGNLSGTIVKELSVDFPSLKEQKAIGDFFRQLDNLITLHQRELEKLQSIKKALLEKMFV